jgi:tripartite-type tricarboxylate transporter receptor subunit TctC
VERHPDRQGAGARRPVHNAARHVPAAKATPDQVAFHVDLFKKITQTPEYKDYMEKRALQPVFLTGPDMTRFSRRMSNCTSNS